MKLNQMINCFHKYIMYYYKIKKILKLNNRVIKLINKKINKKVKKENQENLERKKNLKNNLI